MSYLIYNNITENEFNGLKSCLNSIEQVSSQLMSEQGFILNEKLYEDVLALDYIHKGDNFSGNIGMAYDADKSNNENLFSFYVLKAYDTNNKRFFKREVSQVLYSIEEVKHNFVEKFKECLSKYNSWNKDDLIAFIELPPMP